MKITTIIRVPIFSALLIVVPLFFTGCQDVIYAKIMNEVTLDDATISGSINSIVRYSPDYITTPSDYTDYIFIENGNVYCKKASSVSHDTWNKCMNGLTSVSYDYYNKTFNGMQIIKLAADSQYLYALGITYEEDEDEGKNIPSAEYLYYYDGSTWNKVTSVTTGSTSTSSPTIFCTNTPNPEYRKAYLRTSSGVFLLTGGTLNTTPTDSSATSACSAIYDYASGTVYFNNNWATGSNATTSTTASSTVYYYYVDDDVLYYSTDPSSFTLSSDLGITDIISMAVTSNAILLGTNGGGLYKVSNTDGKPGGSTEDFSTNADSALGSPYRILAMLSVDPSDTETGATIYASADFSGTSSSSTGDYDDIGLWSYYASRGNWNRE
ncbi:MAG: hypothetical protein M0P01_10625 [Treponema sp.]|nr:hypothetical protein [Treponema sp.]